MAVSILCFIHKAPHITTEEFKDHYENVHVPLVRALIDDPKHLPLLYKRHYLTPGPDTKYDYSSVTTLTFADSNAAQKFHETLTSPGKKEKIDADTALFCDMSKGAIVPVEVSEKL